MIIKALQDDSLGWEYSSENHTRGYTETLYSAIFDCRIVVKHAYRLRLLACPGYSSFSANETRAVIEEVNRHVKRIEDKRVEEERLAAIELFKEYREE